MKHFTGIIALLVVGCAEPVDPADDIDTAGASPFYGKPNDDCDKDVCGGGNSPKFDAGAPFHQINFDLTDLDRAEPFSGRGYKVMKIEKRNETNGNFIANCTLSVVNAEVVAKCPNQLQAWELKNVWIFVSTTIGAAETHVMRFTEKGMAPYWPTKHPSLQQPPMTPWYKVVRNVTAGSIPTTIGTGWKDLCSMTTPDPRERPVSNLPANAMVVFEGDRIDPRAKTSTDVSARTVTMACDQNALMKMHIAGLTSAGSRAAVMSADAVIRSTFLKGITATYCGGDSWTIHHQHVDWRTKDGRLPFVYNSQQPEGRFNQFGATCLAKATDTNKYRGPRVAVTQTPASAAIFGTDAKYIRDLVDEECRSLNRDPLPDCKIGPTGPNDMDGHYLVFANPAPVIP